MSKRYLMDDVQLHFEPHVKYRLSFKEKIWLLFNKK